MTHPHKAYVIGNGSHVAYRCHKVTFRLLANTGTVRRGRKACSICGKRVKP